MDKASFIGLSHEPQKLGEEKKGQNLYGSRMMFGEPDRRDKTERVRLCYIDNIPLCFELDIRFPSFTKLSKAHF